MNKKTLLIIDLYGLLFRSYYALSYMPTESGININAVYGVIKSLISLFDYVSHDWVILALDGSGKGIRHEMFSEYKANRIKCPEDLIPQFAILDEFIASSDLKSLRINGYEADDIIATYTKIGKENNANVVISTSDKDLMQLVGDGVSVYSQKDRGFIHTEQVFDNFGVKPSQIVDYLALIGDTSDNIPGVNGIGRKKAQFLLNKYKNIEEIYEKIDEIDNNVIKLALINDRDNAFLSKKLASLIIIEEEGIDKNIDYFGKFNKNSEKFINFCKKYNIKLFNQEKIKQNPPINEQMNLL
ncbi:5'-3' exonuclease [Candidatus Deianiraea vastatrix]|uniref:DNA polymerase I 5'-3' exonuclease domain protein n=1 Tax=Candidatus Deianiraea vastatrix TaxID=2163644 RepID=A0A5B8XG36_9RICK|nr:5'-3' exonuclease H3TH domain-containing protein [Candidatus Deianiraea vastatrix]QED23294.1 Putative DNA polymerase I 5'-3' exonuclease domain protein [Candidatus Deianiraea vastatrix]